MGYGPYGLVGIGEDCATMVPFVIGNASAVHNAIGEWVDDHPMTPDKDHQSNRNRQREGGLLKMIRFKHFDASTIEEAVSNSYRRFDGRAKVNAGGTDIHRVL